MTRGQKIIFYDTGLLWTIDMTHISKWTISFKKNLNYIALDAFSVELGEMDCTIKRSEDVKDREGFSNN